MNNSCLQTEMEYREWRKCPQWYCVKTTYHYDGRIESELVCDETTKLPIVIQDIMKPLDGVYETAAAMSYFTYHAGYIAAIRQITEASRT